MKTDLTFILVLLKARKEMERKMKSVIFLSILILVLVSGCVQKAPIEHGHTHTHGASVKHHSDNVLNCVAESGHHVYAEEMECPIGGENFTSLILGTHSTYGRHLDWEPVSYMRFPTPIPVCPGNGLVVTEREYSNDKLEKLKLLVESKEYKELYKQQHATYFLYAKTLELTGAKSSDQWWLYLNATWEADNCGNKELYKQYAGLAISEAKIKLVDLTPDEENYWVLSIIIANMYRRIGSFDKAEEYFNTLGEPELDNSDSNEFFLLAKKLLGNAIVNKEIGRVKIKGED